MYAYVCGINLFDFVAKNTYSQIPITLIIMFIYINLPWINKSAKGKKKYYQTDVRKDSLSSRSQWEAVIRGGGVIHALLPLGDRLKSNLMIELWVDTVYHNRPIVLVDVPIRLIYWIFFVLFSFVFWPKLITSACRIFPFVTLYCYCINNYQEIY
jgi:hypothetical protein